MTARAKDYREQQTEASVTAEELAEERQVYGKEDNSEKAADSSDQPAGDPVPDQAAAAARTSASDMDRSLRMKIPMRKHDRAFLAQYNPADGRARRVRGGFLSGRYRERLG